MLVLDRWHLKWVGCNFRLYNGQNQAKEASLHDRKTLYSQIDLRHGWMNEDYPIEWQYSPLDE
jgi:hypothetical protein